MGTAKAAAVALVSAQVCLAAGLAARWQERPGRHVGIVCLGLLACLPLCCLTASAEPLRTELSTALPSLVDPDLEAEGSRRLLYSHLEWVPPLDAQPPGGGAPALFAGVNYTKWTLFSDMTVADHGRIMLVTQIMDPSAALSGHCPQYTYIDLLPPLDGTRDLQSANVFPYGKAVWDSLLEPIVFTQGGLFKLCFSPGGTFGIGDGELVPNAFYRYRVYGARELAASRAQSDRMHAYIE